VNWLSRLVSQLMMIKECLGHHQLAKPFGQPVDDDQDIPWSLITLNYQVHNRSVHCIPM
jgi:hypothetical protein